MTALAETRTAEILLDAYAARTCPVKTQNAYDPRLAGWAAAIVAGLPADDSARIELFDGGRDWKHAVLDRWAQQPGVLDLRGLTEDDAQRDGWTGVTTGASVLLGWRLPIDRPGHRVGRPDALVRGADGPDGRPAYHPVVVKWHKIVERVRPARDDRPARIVRTTTVDSPGPQHALVLADHDLRISRRQGDFLQLAHYHRMLESAGLASAGPAWAAVIGTDDPDEPYLAWADLDEPLVRTFSRSEEAGWRLRSVLERYDHEQRFRIDVAKRAVRQDDLVPPPLLVTPVVNDECSRCPWWEHCRPQLDAEDLSLRIDKGPLDSREIVVLRHFGVTTLTDLAAADLDVLSRDYLPEVRHRPGAESRLLVARRRARMLLNDREFERETEGPIEVPSAAVEIDFDLESSAAGRYYLWGFLVDDGLGDPHRQQFASFTELDDESELALAVEALGWLRGLVERSGSALVYHYSGYEVAVVRSLAERHPHPHLVWAAQWMEYGFVDLLEIVKRHFFGSAGLGLKLIARAAGFSWRDDDPGGLNSQIWFADAVHAEDPALRGAAQKRVLEYNEDDVIATHRLRAWLRDH